MSVSIPVTISASGSVATQSLSKYDFTASDAFGNSFTSSRTNAAYSPAFAYGNSAINYIKTTVNGGDKTYTLPFNATVTATDSLGGTGTATATGQNTVNVINYAPSASLTATTDRFSSPYNQQYFYIGEPITLTDACSDYEDALAGWTYTVLQSGSTVAGSTDFVGSITNSSYVSSFTGNQANKTHSITFSQTGIYTITCQSKDELGKISTEYRFTLLIRNPPKAAIQADDTACSYTDTAFADASTDPYDDIIEWIWGEVLYFNEASGEWIAAEKDID